MVLQPGALGGLVRSGGDNVDTLSPDVAQHLELAVHVQRDKVPPDVKNGHERVLWLGIEPLYWRSGVWHRVIHAPI